MSVEDLHHILFTHWALDTTSYADERQRVQIATGLLLAAFTGCRPISLFDTGRKPYTDNSQEDLHLQASRDLGFDESDRDRHDGSDPDEGYESDRDHHYESDSDEGSGSEFDLDERPATSSSLRYRDVDLFIIPPKLRGDHNRLVAKVRLVHTKGEQRRSRSSV